MSLVIDDTANSFLVRKINAGIHSFRTPMETIIFSRL